jgi:hypothetical protein
VPAFHCSCSISTEPALVTHSNAVRIHPTTSVQRLTKSVRQTDKPRSRRQVSAAGVRLGPRRGRQHTAVPRRELSRCTATAMICCWCTSIAGSAVMWQAKSTLYTCCLLKVQNQDCIKAHTSLLHKEQWSLAAGAHQAVRAFWGKHTEHSVYKTAVCTSPKSA